MTPQWITDMRARIYRAMHVTPGSPDKMRQAAAEKELDAIVAATEAGKPLTEIYDDPLGRAAEFETESAQEMTPKQSARLRELRRARDRAGRAW